MVVNDLVFGIASEGGHAPMETPSNPRHRSLVDEDMRHAAKALLLALQPFLDMRSTIPASYIAAFLRVVIEEGQGVTEYARSAETSKTVMTRYLLDLGERDRHGEEGLKIITQQRDNADLRVHRAYVTPKGAGKMRAAKHALELFCAALKR
jgi:hypothetical protein